MNQIFIEIMVLLFGLALGSFLNVVIYRLPRDDMSIGSPRRSACPRCGNEIAWYDNLPVISWLLLLRGRCRHCGLPISIRYPFVELLCGLLVLAVFHHNWPFIGFRTLAEVYFVLALVAITFIDIDHLFIPDELTLPGMVISLAAAAISPAPFLSGFWLQYKLVVWSRGLTGNLLVYGLTGFVLFGTLLWIADRFYEAFRGEEEPEPEEDEDEPPRLGAVAAEFLGRRVIIGLIVLAVLWGGGLLVGALVAPAPLQAQLRGLLLGSPLLPSLIGSVWGMALGGGTVMVIFAAYLLYRGEEGMGLGDLTLLAMIGAFLGWRSIFLVVFAGSISALLVYLVLAAKNRAFNMKEMLPFGPFLSFGALIYLFFGPSILAWYLG